MSAIASAKGASMVTSRLKIHEMWDAIVLSKGLLQWAAAMDN